MSDDAYRFERTTICTCIDLAAEKLMHALMWADHDDLGHIAKDLSTLIESLGAVYGKYCTVAVEDR